MPCGLRMSGVFLGVVVYGRAMCAILEVHFDPKKVGPGG